MRNIAQSLRRRHLRILGDTFISIPDEIAHPWTLQHLMASEEFIGVIDRQGGSAGDWWKLYERAVREVEQGATMRMGMVSVVAQKPASVKL